MKNIALITNYNITEKLAAADAVAEAIGSRAEKIFVPEQYKERIFRARMHRSIYTYLPVSQIYDNADLAIVIGGDGSMLECTRLAAPAGVPVLGINMGRVGYMTELEMDELELLDKVFSGDYTLDTRAMLSVVIKSESGNVKFRAHALNEAVIANGAAARMVDIELYDGDELVTQYRADGLVVATPTGSTAYSLSAGGPIIDPKLSCFCVTPICPHSLVARPLIFPDSAVLEVKNICVREKVLHLTVDGKATFDLFYGDTVIITKSAVTTKLLRIKNEDFYSKIRMKKFI
jgi:NAD+ kinase